MTRGTTYARTLTYKKNGTPTPLTGATIFFTLKTAEWDADENDTSALISKTYANLSDEDAANCKATVLILPIDTKDLEPTEYYYDIRVREDADHIYKVDEGTIELDGSPTNRIA